MHPECKARGQAVLVDHFYLYLYFCICICFIFCISFVFACFSALPNLFGEFVVTHKKKIILSKPAVNLVAVGQKCLFQLIKVPDTSKKSSFAYFLMTVNSNVIKWMEISAFWSSIDCDDGNLRWRKVQLCCWLKAW